MDKKTIIPGSISKTAIIITSTHKIDKPQRVRNNSQNRIIQCLQHDQYFNMEKYWNIYLAIYHNCNNNTFAGIALQISTLPPVN